MAAAGWEEPAEHDIDRREFMQAVEESNLREDFKILIGSLIPAVEELQKEVEDYGEHKKDILRLQRWIREELAKSDLKYPAPLTLQNLSPGKRTPSFSEFFRKMDDGVGELASVFIFLRSVGRKHIHLNPKFQVSMTQQLENTKTVFETFVIIWQAFKRVLDETWQQQQMDQSSSEANARQEIRKLEQTLEQQKEAYKRLKNVNKEILKDSEQLESDNRKKISAQCAQLQKSLEKVASLEVRNRELATSNELKEQKIAGMQRNIQMSDRQIKNFDALLQQQREQFLAELEQQRKQSLAELEQQRKQFDAELEQQREQLDAEREQFNRRLDDLQHENECLSGDYMTAKDQVHNLSMNNELLRSVESATQVKSLKKELSQIKERLCKDLPDLFNQISACNTELGEATAELQFDIVEREAVHDEYFSQCEAFQERLKEQRKKTLLKLKKTQPKPVV